MLRTEQILNAKFTPVSKGTYSAEEVDAFLKTVASSYEESLNENRELIKKISILADKIESYRNDEEAIKLALLDAHRMAESVSKNANEKAESIVNEAEGKSKIILDGANRQSAQMVDEAREKAKEIVDNARTAVASLTERAQKETDATIANAKSKADEIIANAEEKGREIIGTSKQSYEYYSAELDKVKAETSKFKAAIEEICKGQLNLLGDIPVEFAAVAAVIPEIAPVFEEKAEEEIAEEEVPVIVAEEEIAEEAIAEEAAEEPVAEEIEEPADYTEIPEINEEELDPSAAAMMAEINNLAADVMDIDAPVAEEEEEYVEEIQAEEPVQAEAEEDVDDLFSLIDDIDFDSVPDPDMIPSSLDDLIPEITENNSDSVDFEIEDDGDAEEEFKGFRIDLDSITDEADDDEDDDISSLFDSLFDD